MTWPIDPQAPQGDGEARYDCVLPFLTDHPMFARGVEVGMLYEKLRDPRTAELRAMIHAANDEQVIVLASRLSWSVEIEDVADGWRSAVFQRRQSA